jgi:zinc protease
MLFNGLKNFGAEELIETMQGYGIEFGSHITAHTSYDNTIYQLDLPKGGKDAEDTAFMIFRDFCDGALFLPEVVVDDMLTLKLFHHMS